MSSTPPSAAVRTIADLITSDLHAEASEPISRVVQLWEKHPGVDGMAVLGEARVRYISRPRFFIQLGQRFGYSLFENRPVSLLAEEGSTVEADMDPVEAISIATQREPGRIHDDLLVLEAGRFRGLVSMRSLLSHHKSLLMDGIAERAQLEENNRRLKQTRLEQGELMAVLVEQLRAPVTAMFALLRALESDPEIARRHARSLEALLGRAREALGVADDVQEMTRMERGTLRASPETVALPALIEQVLADLSPEASRRRVELIATSGAAPPHFVTDPLFLARVLGSLLKVATDLRPQGRITIAVEGTSQMLLASFRVEGGEVSPRPSLVAGARLATARGLLDLLGGGLDEWPQGSDGPWFRVRVPSHGDRPRGA